MQEWHLSLMAIVAGAAGYILRRLIERRGRSEGLKRRLQAVALLRAMRRERVTMEELETVEQEANASRSAGLT